MGSPKQLLPIEGEPALAVCIKNILAGGITDLVVVLGQNRAAVLPVLAGLPVTPVINHEPQSQMAESVQVGLTATPAGITGILIGLADHPLVLPATYALLQRQHGLRPDKILIPTYRGRGGHPTLFPAFLCRRTANPEPLNRIITEHYDRVERLPVDDPGVVMDMDYPADYHRLLTLAARRQQTAVPDRGVP